MYVGVGGIQYLQMFMPRYGGVLFLIPLTIMFLIVSVPYLFLSIAIGQYTGLGVGAVYSSVAPALRGMV